MNARHSGFTVIEMLTVLVALVVIAAVAFPLWRTHDLRARRADAIEALEALQKAQDRHFGKNAKYASGHVLTLPPPQGLGLPAKSRRGFYEIDVTRSADALGYLATAKVIPTPDEAPDSRCMELRLDQHGRRSAVNAAGADTSADCWNDL
jgi:type IV pilus assembly protein PilE